MNGTKSTTATGDFKKMLLRRDDMSHELTRLFSACASWLREIRKNSMSLREEEVKFSPRLVSISGSASMNRRDESVSSG